MTEEQIEQIIAASPQIQRSIEKGIQKNKEQLKDELQCVANLIRGDKIVDNSEYIASVIANGFLLLSHRFDELVETIGDK